MFRCVFLGSEQEQVHFYFTNFTALFWRVLAPSMQRVVQRVWWENMANFNLA